MITFRHGGKQITVEPGSLWSARSEENTYRDAPAKELWDIVQEVRGGAPWPSVVAKRYEKSNPWLHQIVTSPSRDLFFRQHPPPPNAKILDIGSGWGQIALPLAKNTSHEVTALEPTPERLAFIQAAAAQEQIADRMHFIQADFFDIKFERQSFDLVCCIGVLEWVAKFRAGEPGAVHSEFLAQIRRILTFGGHLVIGIENRLGLKYLLGAPDDHLGVPNIAVYDHDLAAQKWQAQTGQILRSFTFTHSELAGLLFHAGFKAVSFYAALPDYKLPQLILPLGQEVNDHYDNGKYIAEHDGHTGKPLAFQSDLQSHYRTLARLKIAHKFVPSFYVLASP